MTRKSFDPVLNSHETPFVTVNLRGNRVIFAFRGSPVQAGQLVNPEAHAGNRERNNVKATSGLYEDAEAPKSGTRRRSASVLRLLERRHAPDCVGCGLLKANPGRCVEGRVSARQH